MILNKQDSEILLSSKIGFEFEFYSNYKIEKTTRDLTNLLHKKIYIEDKAHSDFVPSSTEYKIEPDMSGGQKLMELVTGPIPYVDARLEFIKILKWIDSNGSTGSKCGMHINISFDDNIVGKHFLSHMNVLKFILEFDEDLIYKIFPQRKKNVYAKSIKHIIPKSKVYLNNIYKIDPFDFIIPNEKYYGINFSKLKDNYLEFRYLGGKDYDKNISDLLRVIDYFIIQLYKSAKDKEFTDDNQIEIKKILNEYKDKLKSFNSPEKLVEHFPDISIMVDLDSDLRRLHFYWSKIQNTIFSILNDGKMQTGVINYDSDMSKIQIKDADLNNSYKIKDIDILDSTISGHLENCDLFGCTVKSSELHSCNLFQQSEINNSKLVNCYTNNSVTLNNCYVDGQLSIMNGTMIGGILRKSKISNFSKFDGVEKIEYEKIKT